MEGSKDFTQCSLNLVVDAVVVVNTGSKSKLGKSGQELKQDGNLEAGIDAEVMEGCLLLAWSF